MPTFRQDLKLGSKVPTIKADDITDGVISSSKLADGAVTSPKLADGSVSVDKLEENLRKSLGSSVDVSVLFAQMAQLNKDLDNAKSSLSNQIIELRSYHDQSITQLRKEYDRYFQTVNNSISSSQEMIMTYITQLMDAVWPIKLSLNVSYDESAYSRTISFSVKCKNEDFVPDNLSITRRSNDSTEDVVIFDKAKANGSFTDTTVLANRETYTVKASAEYHTEQTLKLTRYLCYAGASSSTISKFDEIRRLKMLFLDGIHDFSTAVTTVVDPLNGGQYVQFVLPVYLNLDSVKSAGFDVPLWEVVNMTASSFGFFRIYRTLNRLDAATWKFDLKVSENTNPK